MISYTFTLKTYGLEFTPNTYEYLTKSNILDKHITNIHENITQSGNIFLIFNVTTESMSTHYKKNNKIYKNMFENNIIYHGFYTQNKILLVAPPRKSVLLKPCKKGFYNLTKDIALTLNVPLNNIYNNLNNIDIRLQKYYDYTRFNIEIKFSEDAYKKITEKTYQLKFKTSPQYILDKYFEKININNIDDKYVIVIPRLALFLRPTKIINVNKYLQSIGITNISITPITSKIVREKHYIYSKIQDTFTTSSIYNLINDILEIYGYERKIFK